MATIYGIPDSEVKLLDLYPKEVQKIEDIDKVHQRIKDELAAPHNGFFGTIKKWNKKRQLNRFEKNKDDPFHAGAHGELQVLGKLEKLSNDFHVFCGLKINLNRWLTYQGERNLRSAQMDFVVVSRKGVVLIEVKNWSNQYAKSKEGFNPYEQTERAGKVLWAFLQTKHAEPRVTNVLLATRKNIPYTRDYPHVLISNLDEINCFLENRAIELSAYAVDAIIDMLEN